MKLTLYLFLIFPFIFFSEQNEDAEYDLLIENATVFDGSGSKFVAMEVPVCATRVVTAVSRR